MAKRKRLTPAQPEYLHAPQSPPSPSAPEVKSALGPPQGGRSAVPIARVAGETAAAAALQEVTAVLHAARAEGRMVQKIPLAQIDVAHLRRDRILADAEDLTALVDSIREHGQRTPIEVMALKGGKFGLISGWRRLSALELLAQKTSDPRYDTVLALLRRPKTASDAYVAMVEENEIRAGLSYYERARVVALATKDGVFPTESVALKRLFATASRAKRSKIRSFLIIYRALDGSLRFPAQLGERLGLALAKALTADETKDGGGPRAGVLKRLDLHARTPEEEQAAITAALAGGAPDKPASKEAPEGLGRATPAPTASPSVTPSVTPSAPPDLELRPGVFLKTEGGYLKRRIVLEGPNVTVTFQARLEHWLKTGV